MSDNQRVYASLINAQLSRFLLELKGISDQPKVRISASPACCRLTVSRSRT
jgi:hypothetical protein